MAKLKYDWENGADLKQHTAQKLKILREYFEQYLRVRCQLPQQERFKLCVVDGFAGGGRYKKGEAGSPIVFLETLIQLSNEINLHRAAQNMRPLEIGCRLVLNDTEPNVVKLLRKNMAPVLAYAKDQAPHLVVEVEYLNKPFEEAYPKIRQSLLDGRFRNVLFNLDQYGDSSVNRSTLIDILNTFRASGEVFLTFAIKPLLTYLQKHNPAALQTRLRHLEITTNNLALLEPFMGNNEWLGTAERIVFDRFQECAPFVSTFSLINPEGWRYWLIHFSNVYRARQVYNDVLHDNSNHQAHFGRSGLSLNIFAFDPEKEGTLYMFEENDRERAKVELAEDIPHLVEEFGDAMGVGDFYNSAYNLTPAHSEDIKSALFQNPDLEVLTPSGNLRRKAHTIEVRDTLRLKSQKSFHMLWKK